MFEDGSSLIVWRLSPHQQTDLHSCSYTFRLGYWWGCMVSQHLQPITWWQVLMWHGVAWHGIGGLPGNPAACRRSLEGSACCFHHAVTAACPGKYQMGRIESPACGPAAMLLLGRLYLMFLLFKLLLDLQLCYMACSDFMADIMYVSQSFLCLLLTRKS